MVKPGLGLFAGRRKSQGNTIEDVDAFAAPHAHVHDSAPGAESGSAGGGFRVMTSAEADARKREEKRRASEKASSKFRPFSGFGGAGMKGRNLSYEEDSPASSKRDSKSSSGTGGSRPYKYNNGQFGSTSTLPSSADTDSNDNIFAVPRPHVSHQHSSPVSLSTYKKQLPSIPRPESRAYEPTSPVASFGRVRAMTSSSYASTAKPPTLDADLNFGASNFDDMFSGMDRKESPDMIGRTSPGRSLLNGKRGFQAEPIKIDRKQEVEVEPPLASWDSRDSGDNLMSSSPDRDSPPPPPPPHKFSQYAPVALHSPELNGSFVNPYSSPRRSGMAPKQTRESSPEPGPSSLSSAAPSQHTSVSSHTTASNNTPKAPTRQAPTRPAPTRPAPTPQSDTDDEEEDLFSSSKSHAPVQKPAPQQKTRPPPRAVDDQGRRMMSEAEFRAQQKRATQQAAESDTDPEDYDDDEEEAQQKAEQEAIARRKKQQMDLARESMRRTTTTPGTPGNSNRPESMAESFSMGFPSEISNNADQWEDEDIPLGILAQHGFPNRNKPPVHPANAMPSFVRNQSQGSLPDRPASAGNLGARGSQFRPAFARNLPADPHVSFIGGGLVQPMNRESMGFSRGPGSVYGDPAGMYSEPHLPTPSLVEQIQMRDNSKPKYTGGASNKQPQGGPFTGAMAAQMNPQVNNNPTRMSMNNPGMQGMPGMNPMQPMSPMMNMNAMGPNGMPMMPGMNNGMQYQNEYMAQVQQMQQMIAFQQAQLAQMQNLQQPQQQQQFPQNRMSMMQDPRMSMGQDPRMSMAIPGNNSFLSVPGGIQGQQRPMSMMSATSQQRPYSTGSHMMPNGPHSYSQSSPQLPHIPMQGGFAPSIAPSERSNVGLSKRYRPVNTAGNNDNQSTVSSMTLQASGGATQTQGQGTKAAVKSILKKGKKTEEEEEDERWNKMLARRKGKKDKKGGSGGGDDLADIVRGMDNL
ncbi:hypothetical protein P280DRAFT_231294 [Massarina eburnea CBS 473.64]|uniref:Uncharacterized protein n=1 Tax=Massarina eburnea CBS 473.64 TaxID=1395130 RepID=A0A6A6S9W8_9PLEO|nr:hypothetical protein P280DRAFT_231294 [Massarina eburnea CBS 473.64]